MTDKYKIGYVVLHYQVFAETCACVETLQRVSAENDVIIIVDNHSPNGSGEKLRQKYKSHAGIFVILNSENMGFARGNNAGYAMAKHQCGCDFIILLNNDTLIRQKDFRDRLAAAYEKHHFAVMGPKILCADGTVNPYSPVTPVHTSLRRARIGQLSNDIRYLLSICGLDLWAGQLLDRHHKANRCQTDKYQEDVQIAGCCVIFSREYIDRFEGLNPKTFLYLEEIILYTMVKKAGLKIIYNPELEIVHLEDAATLASFRGKPRKARQFKYKCQMQSFKVLLEELGK